MDCIEFIDRYSEYDDSLVSSHEVGRFRAHMSECPACARYDRVLRKGRMVARQLAVEPSAEFGRRLRARLRSEGPGSPGESDLASRLSAGVAAMTLLLVVAAGVGLLGLDSPPADATRESGPAVPVAAELAGPWSPPSPVAATVADRAQGWPAERVDPAPASSYSPLITGPPAYRSGGARMTR